MILDTNALSEYADGVPAAVEASSRKRRDYEKWLAMLLDVCPVLAIEEDTTIHYAEIREELKQLGRSIPTNDLWIAALAAQHNLPILSRDQHFDQVPRVKRIPW